MIDYLIVGGLVVLLLMMRGGKSGLRFPTWRIGAAMGALFAFAGAAYAMVRDIWPVAIVLAVIGVWMAVSARFPRQSQRSAGPPPNPPPGQRGAMTLVEARAILGVEEGASAKEIQAAYRRLMNESTRTTAARRVLRAS